MPYGDKHIPEDKLKEMLDDLKLHYGEPVRPVSEYCQAFYDWQKVLAVKVKELEVELEEIDTLNDDEYFERFYIEPARRLGYAEYEREKWDGKRYQKMTVTQELEGWKKVLTALGNITIPIAKSNFLWRTIYGDGLVRTEKCPVHKGRWSGYSFDRACEYGCNHGYDMTGWLPEPHDFVEKPEDREPEYDEHGKVTRMGVNYGPRDQCYKCGGTLELGQHVQEDK